MKAHSDLKVGDKVVLNSSGGYLGDIYCKGAKGVVAHVYDYEDVTNADIKLDAEAIAEGPLYYKAEAFCKIID